MARANRHHIPGQVWHITHRCHKKEFLLKFAKDRLRWHSWLFEAKKRFELRTLNYVTTSNHIHLFVIDSGSDVISKSLHLIAGRKKCWTESIAVGNSGFVEETKAKLGIKAQGRKI